MSKAVPPTSGFITTTELDPKFVPVTVICVAGALTCALAGDTLAIVGAGPTTVNGIELLVFVPSFTLTCTRAAEDRSAAKIGAVS